MPTLFDDESTSRHLMPSRKPRNRALLRRVGGHEAGRVYELGSDEVTLGRSSNCTFQIEDASLSRVHASVRQIAGEYVLEDRGSRNGCYVNEQRVERASLADGDRVQFGPSVSLRFHVVDDDELAALVRVYESSVRDGLTGVYNRRHLDELLSAEVSYAVRHAASFSIVLFDVDRFKAINDTYGHPTGDTVLRAIASVIASNLRPGDTVARYGGEEFMVLARATDLVGAADLADRLRASIERLVLNSSGGPLRVTASAGVASLACCPSPPDARVLVVTADRRLYEAKRSGRNRVVSSG